VGKIFVFNLNRCQLLLGMGVAGLGAVMSPELAFSRSEKPLRILFLKLMRGIVSCLLTSRCLSEPALIPKQRPGYFLPGKNTKHLMRNERVKYFAK
jgi:hypothetical protein